MPVHAGDQMAGNLGFERGSEKGLACTDGVDDDMLSGNGSFKKLGIASVALYDPGTLQRLSRWMMDQGRDDMAALTRQLNKSSTGFPICADDEDVDCKLRAVGAAVRLDAQR